MKKTRVKVRMLQGFLTIACIAAIVGIAGLVSAQTMAGDAARIDKTGTEALTVASLQINLQAQRATYRGAALKEEYDMHPDALEDLALLEELDLEYQQLMSWVQSNFTSPDEVILVESMRSTYGAFSSVRDHCAGLIRNQADWPVIRDSLVALTPPMEYALDAVDRLVLHTASVSSDLSVQAQRHAVALSVVLSICILIAVGLAVVLAVRNATGVSLPISALAGASRLLSSGHTQVDLPGSSRLLELEELTQAYREVALQIQQQSETLERISGGDFTAGIPVRSDEDVMNASINKLVKQNARILTQIRTSSNQVSTAVREIAHVAQGLSVESVQQASAVQRFSSSVLTLREAFGENARVSSEALQEVEQSRHLMEESDDAIQKLVQAITAIRSSANSISAVIEVIEEISFQTGILALNASIEAARAGHNGRGFAVVAGEIKNLAQKSSMAVRETSALIGNGAAAVHDGLRIADETLQKVRQANEIGARNAEAIVQISKISLKQTTVMDDIAQDINQISDNIQLASATAEEIAAAIEEISAQADVLLQITGHFKLEQNAPNTSDVAAERERSTDSIALSIR